MLNERQERLCTESRWDFSDLSKMVLVQTTLVQPDSARTRPDA